MLHQSISNGQWDLTGVPGVLPGPMFYTMAVECGNWDAAVRACIIMIRAEVNEDAWRLRLKGALRARHRKAVVA